MHPAAYSMRRGFPVNPRLTLYTKKGCSLCDKAKETIRKVASDVPLDYEEFDITKDPATYEKYRWSIPVLAIDGKEQFVTKVSEVWLRRALQERGRG